MSESKKVYIFGYSGHAFVVIESLLDAGYSIGGYFDFNEATRNPYNIPYLGFEGEVDLKQIVNSDFVFPAIGDNSTRQKLVGLFEELNLNQLTIVDPSAKISRTARIAGSTYIGKNAILNAQCDVKKGVIINSQATIEHECIIDDFVHIAPNAVLCGNVHVGSATFIGANSVIRENQTVCSNAIVGAGAVIVKSITDKGIWVGNPVRKL